MSRTAYKFSVVIGSLLITAALAACGSDNREGGSPSTVARVADEATCRVCHAASIDPVSGTSIVADFLTTTNSHNQPGRANVDLGCEGCHGGGAEHNGVGPIPYPDPLNVRAADGTLTTRCIVCHTANGLASPNSNSDLTPLFNLARAGFVTNNCAHCHTASGVGSVHGAMVPLNDSNCIACHDVAAPQHGADRVGDNNGVRAITVEFTKWSHHVTGVTLNAVHCTVCHLEGTLDPTTGSVIMDDSKHMVDGIVHLRNADDDSDMQWDPANPNHTTMDNFCMSCHDANGATSPINTQIQRFINNNALNAPGKTASASNPFGDTISNRYDKMQRPAVVDAKDQFDPANNSHHAVRGQRYSGRTRLAGLRQIASPGSFANNSSSILKGKRSTIYDAGNFNSLYSPLGTDGTDATGLGDDSTLHCGDCHTVGQWKPGSSDTANGSPTPAAIGAHGSNNEYLLRNTLGTDQRHTQNAFTLSATNVVTYTNPGGAFLVCYNCHAYTRYGSIYVGTGLDVGQDSQPHAGEYDQAGRCNGIGNTLPFNGYTTGVATDGTQFISRLAIHTDIYTTTTQIGSTTFTASATAQPDGIVFYGQNPAFAPGFPLDNSQRPTNGEQPTDFGDIFGIQCANCHNSGIGNAYGGIHGSANNQNTVTKNTDPSVTGGAYIDGLGNTTKIERFLPGLGNAMHVPGTLGGVTNGVTNDTNWEQKHWQQTASTNFNLQTGAVTGTLVSAGAGCYTLGTDQTVANNVTAALRGPSVTGAGGAPTQLYGTWGGCDDHTAAQGAANHGFVKRILRPVTY